MGHNRKRLAGKEFCLSNFRFLKLLHDSECRVRCPLIFKARWGGSCRPFFFILKGHSYGEYILTGVGRFIWGGGTLLSQVNSLSSFTPVNCPKVLAKDEDIKKTFLRVPIHFIQNQGISAEITIYLLMNGRINPWIFGLSTQVIISIIGKINEFIWRLFGVS